jgi:hypothetical protein
MATHAPSNDCRCIMVSALRLTANVSPPCWRAWKVSRVRHSWRPTRLVVERLPVIHEGHVLDRIPGVAPLHDLVALLIEDARDLVHDVGPGRLPTTSWKAFALRPVAHPAAASASNRTKQRSRRRAGHRRSDSHGPSMAVR